MYDFQQNPSVEDGCVNTEYYNNSENGSMVSVASQGIEKGWDGQALSEQRLTSRLVEVLVTEVVGLTTAVHQLVGPVDVAHVVQDTKVEVPADP